MRRLVLWVPLAVFLAFLVTVGIGLYSPAERTIRSRMIGQPIPAFALQPMLPDRPGVSSGDFARGTPRIVNVFASWCVPCIAEAPQMMALAARSIPIDAIAIRDRPEDVAAFLAEHGNPFDRIGSDPQTRVQIAFGSSGVPETFVIDGKGVIRHQHIGDIKPENVPEIIHAYEAAK